MQNKLTHIIGLMSGTSLDGVDLVYVSFNEDNYSQFEIINTKTYPYEPLWKEKLQHAISLSNEALKVLNEDYGILLGMLVADFMSKNKITDVDFIASHGHTVFHQPEKGITLQIGDGQKIADITNVEVICDFRTQDVELGGQGAPLVPIGDELLFEKYDYCLNLGGFANVSYNKKGERIAFDICPVNIVLNKYAKILGYDYDDKGKIASSGSYLKELDTDLKRLAYYEKLPPKSLGLEWVQKEIFPRLELTKRKPEDLLRTYTEHAAWAIAKAFSLNAKVLVTGGGVFNDYLIERVKFYKKLEIVVPNKDLIEFKEALIFAFLGLLRKKGAANCLKSVTGASKNHSSGVFFYPNN